MGMQGSEHFLNENLQNISFSHFLSSLYKSRELPSNIVFLFGKMKNVQSYKNDMKLIFGDKNWVNIEKKVTVLKKKKKNCQDLNS